MEQEILSKDMIPQPELWRCAMEIGSDRLDVALFPPVATERLIHRTVLLNPDAPSHEKAVQEAIYANPLLLSDFARIDVLIDTPDFALVPAETARSAEPEAFLEAASFDLTDKIAEVSQPCESISTVFAVPAPLAGFIRRTFFNVRINHSLAPLIATRLHTSAIFASVTESKVDIIAADGNNLLLANSFRCTAPEDATYYIVAVRNNLPIEQLPIILAGNGDKTDTIEKYLIKYAVAPERAEVPTELARLGKDAMTLPQSLIALLSCE